ncbi:hypothetical protein DmAi_12320 [Acetobacter persici]|uniref:Uncharacterized protein n=1 Tax=Acetobacter persici TaxID=1076596 RepID=A0A6V8I6H4_9PROT|nr:hypothetical protein DmAi_12320 [Acetobacter persici]
MDNGRKNVKNKKRNKMYIEVLKISAHDIVN